MDEDNRRLHPLGVGCERVRAGEVGDRHAVVHFDSSPTEECRKSLS
jgi:hypothetical protein